MSGFAKKCAYMDYYIAFTNFVLSPELLKKKFGEVAK